MFEMKTYLCIDQAVTERPSVVAAVNERIRRSGSIKIYKDHRIFIKIELIFIKITNPLSDLYKNHYTASWRPGGHLDIYKDQRQALAAGCLPRAQAVPVCFGYC